ncbi:MAG: hypothetical protein Q9217_006938 [Psora testacea]
MIVGKAFFSWLLSASAISAKYLTITAGSSKVTTTVCRTTLATSLQESIPTRTYARTALLPEVEIVLAVSTPAKTVTPPTVTATNTLQTYITTTVTASTATGTFSTTTTLFETDSITTTETSVSTSTLTETSTSRSVVTEPAPSSWIPVKNSTGLRNLGDQAFHVSQEAHLQQSDLQQPLQDDESSPTPNHHGRLELRSLWPPKIPSPPGIPGHKSPWSDLYPSSVTCMHYVRTRYVKMIIFVQPYYTTTTIPAATSTTTSTETVSSTTTIVPDSVTVIKSFSSTSTTTTTFTSVVTDISSTTECVNATTTTTTYAACFTENKLGPRLDNGKYVENAAISDFLSKPDMTLTDTAYDCCVDCLLSSQNCQYSVWYPPYAPTPGRCGRLLNPAICRGQEYEAGIVRQEPYDPAHPLSGFVVSNGPCGQVTS